VPGDISRTGDSTEANLLIGGNFANGKGNATVFFDYKKDKPILESQYDYSACSTSVNAAGTAFTCGGSSTSYPGRFVNGTTGDSFTIANAQGGVRPFTANDQFNFAPYNYFQRPDERYGFSTFVHYDVNPHARVYGEFNFHDSHTEAQIAPSGIFAFQEVFMTNDNPLLSQDFKNTFGITPSAAGDVLIARRNFEGGGRVADLRHVVSLRGRRQGRRDEELGLRRLRPAVEGHLSADLSQRLLDHAHRARARRRGEPGRWSPGLPLGGGRIGPELRPV
jgi:hypothetical protein